jgi:hypothetical protein
MKAKGRSGIVETNRSRRGAENNIKRKSVEYSTIGYKVTTTFIIILGMCRGEGV